MMKSLSLHPYKSLSIIITLGILYQSLHAMNKGQQWSLSIETSCTLPPAPASEHVIPSPGEEQLYAPDNTLVLIKFTEVQSSIFHEQCSPETKKNLGMDPEQSNEDCLRDVHEEYFEKHALAYAIYALGANQALEIAGFISIQQDESYKYGQLCYWLCRHWRGRRLIEQAFPLISDEYFRIFPDRETISAHVLDGNEPSLRKLDSLGFARHKDQPTIYDEETNAYWIPFIYHRPQVVPMQEECEI